MEGGTERKAGACTGGLGGYAVPGVEPRPLTTASPNQFFFGGPPGAEAHFCWLPGHKHF